MTRWYVVQTKPRQELVAQENLERQGYTTYYPQITLKRRRRGTWHTVTEPLFPRYLFVQLTEGEDNFAPINSTLGVSNLLRFGDKPAQISSQAIKAIETTEKNLMPGAGETLPWKPGDKVQILDGPFSGLSGIFQKQSDQQRVFVLLELLGKENSVKLDANSLA